jgi:hypothetical protein
MPTRSRARGSGPISQWLHVNYIPPKSTGTDYDHSQWVVSHDSETMVDFVTPNFAQFAKGQLSIILVFIRSRPFPHQELAMVIMKTGVGNTNLPVRLRGSDQVTVLSLASGLA